MTRSILIALILGVSAHAHCDFFGGDLPLLANIVANTAQQLSQLQSILGANEQTLKLLQDANRGIHDALEIVKSQNSTLDPGVLSDLGSAQQILGQIEKLYGSVPMTAQAPTQQVADTTVAQSIHLHNEAFRYAEKLDPVVERLKSSAANASPGSAQKITANAVGVLIHATNQVLRTNAALLKVQSEQLAIQNRREKQASEQARALYIDVPRAMMQSKPNYNLPRLK